jgi:hypothetical protein
MLVSSNVVLLFTRVALNDTSQLLEQHFLNRFVSQVLTSAHFLFEGRCYEQTDGVAMGSPLAPVIANFYMEYFDETALRTG